MNLYFFALLIIVLFSTTANAIPFSSPSFHNKSEWIQKYKICTSNQQNDDTTAVEYSNGKYFLCFSPSLNYAASYETETGTLIWKQENIPTFASFTAGRVHIFEFANLLFFKTVGLNLTSGKILWTNPHAGHECQSSYYAADVFMDSLSLENSGNDLKNESVDNNNILIISCTVDMVYPIWALDSATGELLWEKSIERRRFSGSGNIVNHVFPAVVDNVMYGFDTLSGKLLWTNNNFPLPPAPSSQFLKEKSKFLSTSSSAAPGTKNDPIISLMNQNFDQNNYLTVPASQLIYNLANSILVSFSRYQYFSQEHGDDDMLHLFAVNPQNGTEILWNASEIPGFSTLKNSRVQFLEVSVDSSSSKMPSRPVATSVFVSMNTQRQIELRHSRTGQLVIKSETLFSSSSSSSIPKIFNIAVCVPGIIYILVPDMTLYVFQADIQQKSDGTWKFISTSVVPSFSSNTNNILQNLVSTGEFTSSILGVGSFDFVNNLVSVELFASSFENFVTSNQTIGTLTIPSTSQINGFISYYSQNLSMHFVGVMIPGSGMFVYVKT